MSVLSSHYRATGADWPFGDPLPAHGVAMEGYFWRFTQPDRGRTLIALCGANTARDGRRWATLALGTHPTGFLRTRAHPEVRGDADALRVEAGSAFRADADSIRVDLGPDAQLEATIHAPVRWPRRTFGGSGLFHCVPGLNQYWHPWLLGGIASGRAVVDGTEWNLDGAAVYAEKNWGRAGFPESWWWGQAQGFDEPSACLAFAGGQVRAGPLSTEVTVVVLRLPNGRLLRLGDPVISPVRAEVEDESWVLRGASPRWRIDIRGEGPIEAAHVLPVPIPDEHRNVPGAIEHLGARLHVELRRRHRGGDRLVWSGKSTLAALEHGGIDRARAEMARRGADPDADGAAPTA